MRVAGSRLRFIKRGLRTYVTVDPPGAAGASATFSCDQFEMVGEVDLDGARGETGAGYTLGFAQAQWIETNRANYRGLAPGDGWSEVKLDRAPARPAQACRDSDAANELFAYSQPNPNLGAFTYHHPLRADLASTSTFPATVTISHLDAPQQPYELVRTNALTGKPNYLSWVQLEFHFCTVLLLRRPDGSLHQLKNIYWNVHWLATFTPQAAHGAAAGATPVLQPVAEAGGNRMSFGAIIDGAVNDSHFSSIITAASTTTCNDVADFAAAHPHVSDFR